EGMTRIAGVLAIAALVLAGCGGPSGYGAGAVGGASGAKPAAAAPGPHVLDGVPAAAVRTLSTTARVSLSLDRASAFGSTRARRWQRRSVAHQQTGGSTPRDMPWRSIWHVHWRERARRERLSRASRSSSS